MLPGRFRGGHSAPVGRDLILPPREGIGEQTEELLSLQTESRHFMKVNDTVQQVGGETGWVVDATALYALVEWRDGRREEVDQFDPRVEVIDRAAKPD